MSNKTTSVNLRDKIAKLIKDIVVHHGDNIQYVQLVEHLNGTNRINGSNGQTTSDLISPDASCSEANNTTTIENQETFIDNETSTPQPTSNSNTNNSNGSGDDVPLIQP